MFFLRTLAVTSGMFIFLAAVCFGYDMYFIHDEILTMSKDDSALSFEHRKHDALVSIENLISSSHSDSSLVGVPLSEAGLQLVWSSLIESGKLELPEEYSVKNTLKDYLALDYKRIVPLSFPCEHNAMTFVAPFAITTKQSAVFWFLGLFNFNHQSGTMVQVDSVLIGTDVSIEQLLYQSDNQEPNNVSLAYRQSSEQAGETFQSFHKTFVVDKQYIRVN